MKFEKVIYETSEIRLVINFDGISDDIARAEEIKLKIWLFFFY